MKRAFPILVIASAIGCSSPVSETQRVQVASVSFEVPADWERVDWKARGVLTSTWTPRSNQRKESVTIIRSETNPAVAAAGAPTIERLLAGAQASLPKARMSRITTVAKENGLSGLRVEVDFTPQGLQARYHRAHAVLVEGKALVHVLYTARDPNLDAFNLVLASIRHEEG